MRFGAPAFLWLLAVPALLAALWIVQLARRLRDRRRLLAARPLPVRERLPRFGDLPYWLFALLALAACIVALARPQAVVATVRDAGVDLVVLQDGSASMHVADVDGNRWQRSMRFARVLAETLRWERDRVALALFAHIATPQVRLTKDPNTLFFFLDHLEDRSPFRLQDEGTWDTNIERGIYWGVRLVERDREMREAAGLDPIDNGQAFVLVSDGQAWSGEVAASLALARDRRIPVYVVGVGTLTGGLIPPAPGDTTTRRLVSSLDRPSLLAIASAGGGRYYELDRDADRDIANAIVEETRRRAPAAGVTETTDDQSWRALAATAVFLGLGLLFLRDPAALALQIAAAGASLALVTWLV